MPLDQTDASDESDHSMPKVTILGAGSAVFARQLMTDILLVDGLDEGEFALVDLDAERLELAHQIAARLIERSGKRWRVTASTDRTAIMGGSDFLINTIEVAGLANVRHDYEIPLKYGIDECIGDTRRHKRPWRYLQRRTAQPLRLAARTARRAESRAHDRAYAHERGLTHARPPGSAYALMFDPTQQPVSIPADLSALFDEMWQAERPYLEAFP